MRFHFSTLLGLSAALLSCTVLASPVAENELEAPTRASIHERAARTSIAPRCWSGTAFPPMAAWTPFPRAFKKGLQAFEYWNDTNGEIASIEKAILSVSKGSGFDSRFILAIILRESGGDTTVACNDMGKSCGIMQVQGVGVPSCKKHPCPYTDIHKMIHCGVVGCSGSSISDCASRYGRNNYGAIARCYNTGSVTDPKDYTRAAYGIRTYVQDVGNILLASNYSVWDTFDNGKCGFVNKGS